MPRPDAWICTGKDCRKATSPLKKLRAALSDHRVEEVRCQKICKGPVVGVRIKGEVQWSPQGQSEVPVYERFYLGGQSFRGFDFRTISPKGVSRLTR